MAQHTDATAPTYLSLYEVLLFITTLKDPKAHIDLLWKQCHYIVKGDIALLTAKPFPATRVCLTRELDYSVPAESEPVMRITFSESGCEFHFALPSICFESKDPRKDYMKWDLTRRLEALEASRVEFLDKFNNVIAQQADLRIQLNALNEVKHE